MAIIRSYCLYKSIRVVYVIVIILGVAMIIYSLWLMKLWTNGVLKLPSPSSAPKPWFIYSCLGMGIVVCLEILVAYVVSHYMTNSILAMYVGSISALLLTQGVTIVMVFFQMDWHTEFSESISDKHKEFKEFFLQHVAVTRLITITAFVAQIIVAILAIILWRVGTEPTIRYGNRNPPNPAINSFLVDYNSPLLENP
ncbi:hypothetical protein M9H77_19175 [Catharanthus roseus]|uniref:Uncharacterized protein n=1 Tax=Catharanthus roseus TaxID=4058 RepID=A0ACC0B9P1_CATRO|nr:hypothetical protein M9H77_19175 [Catharanthus roseus]